MTETAVRANGLGKKYRLGTGPAYGRLTESVFEALRAPFRQSGRPEGTDGFWALRDVSFEIKRGEVVGIIGRNGAGKTTLLKVLSRITEPTEGIAEIDGRIGTLLEVGTGFHPELTGRENVYLNGAILGMRKAEIHRRFDQIASFAEIERFLDTPVKRYSSGMHVRLAFSVAAHLEPDVLIVDEVLAVGDVAFQRKCLERMDDVAQEGRTVLFVSHNMAAVKNLCSRAYLLENGSVVSAGLVDDVVPAYLSAVSEVAVGSLENRTDREGSGRLRMTAVQVQSNAGGGETAILGEEAVFEISYRASGVLRNVEFSLALYSLVGEGVLHLSNSVSGDAFDTLPSEGTVECRLSKLPLLPGAYDVNVYCTVNGVVADWVQRAARIHVIEGDFFGSGKLPPPGYGAITVEHRWRNANP